MRRLIVSGLLLGLLSFGVTAHSAVAKKDRCESLAKLERSDGQVRVTHSGEAFPQRNLKLPHALCPGDKVQTVSKAQALVRHVGGEVVLAENSTLNVLSVEKIALEQGAALFNIAKRAGKVFVAETPLIVIGVKGTRFLVNANDSRNDVALFNGSVGVTQLSGKQMAYYRAKSVADMSFEEYQAFQQKAFKDYRDAIHQAFDEYKKQTLAEFSAFVSEVDLKPRRQLTLGTTAEGAEAIDAPINPAFEALNKKLKKWLP